MPRPKILVVDDDPDLVRALRLRLRANNYEVATATDGYTAIASAQKERPALIILDLGLPVGMDLSSWTACRTVTLSPGFRSSCSARATRKATRSAP
jgi:two-component system KDP operon response regulator KdpE